MKLGVLTNLFGDLTLEEALTKFEALGIEAAEIGCGGYPGKAHCNPKTLLADEKALADFRASFDRHGIELACLSVHGNPVHPNTVIAKQFHDDFTDAVLLAEKLGIDTVVTFSGCPGGSPEDKTPNWATCAWPDDFLAVLDYQWNQVLIPYWKKTAAFAEAHGVTQIAFEMHPGFCVYNPETLLRIRKEVGPIIGANFDPSHLFWQGIDPVEAIRCLGKENAIHHFHAKDTWIDPANAKVNGVLDTKHYGDIANRSWTFRSVGYGHDQQVWREMISMLRITGYDHVLSIEHEDALMTSEEGFEKAVAFLQQSMIKDPAPTEMFWA